MHLTQLVWLCHWSTALFIGTDRMMVWPKTRPGALALNAARPGLKHSPAVHTVLRNRNATSHATSKRRPPPGLVYCEVKLSTVGMPT